MAAWVRRLTALLALVALGGLAAASTAAAAGPDPSDDPPPRLTRRADHEIVSEEPADASVMARPDAETVAPVEEEAAPTRRSAPPARLHGAAGTEDREPIWSDPSDGDDSQYADSCPAIVYSSGHWMNDGCWFAQGDFVIMHHTNPKEVTLAEDTTLSAFDNLTAANTFSANQDGFGISAGARVTVGRYFCRDLANRDWDSEVTYLGPFAWQHSGGIQSTVADRLYTPLDPGFLFTVINNVPIRNAVYGGFNAAETQTLNYESNLNSIEWNVRTRYRLGEDMMVAMPNGTWTQQMNSGPTPSLLAGIRYFHIDEHLVWHSERSGLLPATGNYDVHTSNNLIGLQIGAEWARQEKRYRLAGWIKMGGYVNFADENSVVLAIDADPRFQDINSNRSASDKAFTFAGEAGFDAAYHINPHMSLRAGGEILWIQSVAVATEQLNFNFTAPQVVNLSGNSFFMGATVGMEFVW
ncbi:MAG: BBP7 family outer membrane beta-barrel protein [Planctomycetia bacterium]|nr:BBP7 family outer membrane beta-barrel protein [Planctomycetia bacterium]